MHCLKLRLEYSTYPSCLFVFYFSSLPPAYDLGSYDHGGNALTLLNLVGQETWV